MKSKDYKISFIGRLHRNYIIQMIFCQEIDCKSNLEEEEINTENRVAIEIEKQLQHLMYQ